MLKIFEEENTPITTLTNIVLSLGVLSLGISLWIAVSRL